MTARTTFPELYVRDLLQTVLRGQRLTHTPLGDELLAEARFFQLRELIAYLEGKGNHYAAHQVLTTCYIYLTATTLVVRQGDGRAA